MGRREGFDGSDSDSDEASVVGFFGGVGFDNGGDCGFWWRWVGGLGLDSCEGSDGFESELWWLRLGFQRGIGGGFLWRCVWLCVETDASPLEVEGEREENE